MAILPNHRSTGTFLSATGVSVPRLRNLEPPVRWSGGADAVLSSTPMEAAFFDLDKTVIAKASMLAFGGSFYREGLISRRTVLRTLFAQAVYLHLGASDARLAQLRESALALIKGWDQNRVRSVVEEAMDRVVAPIVYREALDLIEAHKAAGRFVVIVSAAPEEIVLPLGRHLGAHASIASRPRVGPDGRYTGEMEMYAYGPFKAEAMGNLAAKMDIDLQSSYSYSDSYTDVPMLEAVGHPVVVNPDRVLNRLARERGWEVRQFRRQVRMAPDSGRSGGSPLAGRLVGAVLSAAAAAVVGRFLGTRRISVRRSGSIGAPTERCTFAEGPVRR